RETGQMRSDAFHHVRQTLQRVKLTDRITGRRIFPPIGHQLAWMRAKASMAFSHWLWDGGSGQGGLSWDARRSSSTIVPASSSPSAIAARQRINGGVPRDGASRR